MDAFRVHSAEEIRELLGRLVAERSPLHLSAPDGALYATSLARVDARAGIAAFAVDAASPALRRLLGSREITAVGYLDRVKLQFDLHGVLLVEGRRECALHASLPREVFRFQRRASPRVRPLPGSEPTASLRHPAQPALQLALRVLDVSVGGVALFVPDGVPPIAPGLRIESVAVALDARTRFAAALHTRYVSAIDPDAGGMRLGCEWVGLGDEAVQCLKRFVERVECAGQGS